jgi:hypothetical protein
MAFCLMKYFLWAFSSSFSSIHSTLPIYTLHKNYNYKFVDKWNMRDRGERKKIESPSLDIHRDDDDEKKCNWISGKMNAWEENINTFVVVRCFFWRVIKNY